MDEEDGGLPESQALIPATMERRVARRESRKRLTPNYRRRVRTRGTPRMRFWIVAITATALLLASYFIPSKDGDTGWRRRLSGGGGLCVATSFEEIGGGVVAFLVFMLLLTMLFIGLAIVTDDYFVPALVVISAKLELSEDVAGATFMAAGSSAPELFTSLADTLFTEESNIGIGTIVGSAVFNILVIIACAGAFAPEVLYIDWRPMTRDISFYCASIILLFICTYWDDSCGIVGPAEGFGMFAFYFAYVLFMVYNEAAMSMCTDPTIAAKAAAADGAKKESEDKNNRDNANNDLGPPPQASSTVRSTVDLHSKIGFGHGKAHKQKSAQSQQDGGSGYDARPDAPPDNGSGSRGKNDGDDNDDDDEETAWEDMSIDEKILELCSIPWNKMFEFTIPDVNSEDLREELQQIMDEYENADSKEAKAQLSERSQTKRTQVDEKEKGYTFAFTISIIWIGTIAAFMVLLAERCGCIIGIPSPIMGVTVLAAGTSIPDALGSIIAAKSRQGDMAVANAIGSNVFDILIGLGLPYGIYGVTEEKAKIYGGYLVNMNGIIAQMVILFLTVLATFVLFMFFQWRLTSGLGSSMLVIYLAFCIYSVWTANDPRWYAADPKSAICTPCPLSTGSGAAALKILQAAGKCP